MPAPGSRSTWIGVGAAAVLWALSAAACDASVRDAAHPGDGAAVETVPVRIAGETFRLELALDPATRHRGLGGRRFIPDDGGMLFALPAPRFQAFVMRGCHVPIDVAFLDAGGRVVAIHAMKPEPLRRPDETPAAYEARLRTYPSLGPSQFAIETAGGRLAEVGLVVGQRVHFDRDAIARRAR